MWSSETFVAMRDPRLECVAAVEAVQPWKTRIIVSLEGLSASWRFGEAHAHVLGERRVALVDLDEGLGLAGLEVQDEHAVVEGRVVPGVP
jgi:hypothetical protein